MAQDSRSHEPHVPLCFQAPAADDPDAARGGGAGVLADAPDPRRHLRAAARHRRRQHQSGGGARLPPGARHGPADRWCSSGSSSRASLTFDFGKLDVDRAADRRGGRPALPAFAAGRHHGDDDRDPARHPARHHLGGQAEHLDRLCGARLLHRRRRHAVVLARHPHHPRHPDHLEGLVRHALDAAHQVRADLGRPAATT